MRIQAKITDIMSYQDFKNRCGQLHAIIKNNENLGYKDYITIEALIYTLAQAIVAEHEYQQLSEQEKKERSQSAEQAFMNFIELTRDYSVQDAILLNPPIVDVDDYLKGNKSL